MPNAKSGPSPTVRRFELANRLRQLRTANGRSPEDVAKELACSTSKITRIEKGERLPTPLDLKVLGYYYGLTEAQRNELQALAADARRRGWWHDFRALEDQAQIFYGLEAAASAEDVLSANVVTGLLQTEAYTRSLVPRLKVPKYWSTEGLEQLIEARTRRQQRILNGEMHLRAVLDESVLSREIGPPPLMTELLAHLIELSDLPNVELQIIPLQVGAHPGLEGSFVILRFEGGVPGDVVHTEHLSNIGMQRAEDRPEEIAMVREVHEHLRGVAMTPAETKIWLQKKLRRPRPRSNPRTITA